jgi:hypothetical protein
MVDDEIARIFGEATSLSKSQSRMVAAVTPSSEDFMAADQDLETIA